MLKPSTRSWIFLFLGIVAILLFADFFVKNYRLLGFSYFGKYNMASLSGDFNKENQDSLILDNLPTEENIVLPDEVNENSVVFTEEEKQNLLDDIQEKIDLIKQEIAELEKNLNPDNIQKSQEEEIDKKEKTENKKEEEQNNNNQQKETSKNSSSGGGGTIKITYSKILISEVQTSGQDDEKHEFVELYNPSSQPIDLTGWYLQRKTAGGQSWSTYASNNLFSGKTIGSNDYFLISREGYYSGSNDIFTSASITDDNSFALKNPNGEISDKLGFGLANDFETSPAENPQDGQSIGRKFDETSQAYIDTDNNSADFEINIPTPRAKNIKYKLPAPLKNILINEVQIAGLDNKKDEFVELYNPNDVDVDLTGFALKRKTKSGNENNLVSAGKFTKTIPKLGYFLIVPQDDGDIKNYTGEAVPSLYYSVKNESMADNNTILLYGKNGIVQDKVGFGLAVDYEESPALVPQDGESIGRTGGADTDNNNADFTIFDEPTPKAENK